MDARVDGVPVTARVGKAVEVNALWINGLAAVAGLRTARRRRAGLHRLREQATASFGTRFRSSRCTASCRMRLRLFDVLDGPDGDDPSIRPNQLLAYAPAARPAAWRPPCRRGGAVRCSPRSGRAASRRPTRRSPGTHRGAPADRDRAYHQGTVWPWLIGPYVDAADTASWTSPWSCWTASRRICGEWGLGSVSETADGDAPHAATGCPFQAWSVAETLRVRRNCRLTVTP